MKKQQGMLWLHLNTASRTKLLKACSPHFATTFCDHVTLRFDVTIDDYEAMIGKEYTISAYEHCWDNDVQAVRVDTQGLPDQYGVPHITISAGDGVEPFTSVAMLQGAHESTALTPFSLTGSVVFVLFKTL